MNSRDNKKSQNFPPPDQPTDIPIYDAHVHIEGDTVIAPEVSVQELDSSDSDSVIRYMETYGIDKTLLIPHDRIPSPPRDYDFREINETVASFAEDYPEKVISIMRLNPVYPTEKVKKDMDYFLGERGLRGVKMVGRADFFRPTNMELMAPVMEKADEYDVPILFHSGHPSRDLPSLQGYLAKQFPSVKVVIAHMGLHDFLWESIIACKEVDNIYVDMSQAWPYDIKIFLKEIGSERMMYGTDAPFQSPRVEQLKVRVAANNEKELNDIFYNTAEKVWGF